MLKQSLIQEKLSDLSMAAQTSSSNTGTGATSGQSSLNGSNPQTDIDIPHINQWPRVQIIKTTTKSKLVQNYTLTQTQNENTLSNLKYLNRQNESNSNNDDNENLDYDGVETVNFYSNHNRHKSNLNENNPINRSANNPNNNNNNQISSSSHNYQNNQTTHQNQNDKNIKIVSDSNQYDPTLKLKYLEKSIKFIQQQHNETLNSLHQEIEKLKNENRELHFKLATRKTSANSLNNLKKESSDLSKTKNEEILSQKIEQRGFDKVLKEALKEKNLDKRLNDMKLNFETTKFEDLFTRLVDAESKNEYLTSILTQLQAKRSINSAFKSNVNNNTTTTATTTNNNNNNNTNSNNNNQAITTTITKININQIYSIDPLKIKFTDNEEPRAPSLEESEIIIKKLFEVYKQQKQQISNMKIVLKDMMHNENLSNQAILMTKDLLENPNKFSPYLLENSNLNKLSVLAPLTNYQLSRSSNGRLNLNSNSNRYHSQVLTTNGIGYDILATGPLTATSANSNINLPSIVHLPPLQSINPAKFPERQKRTQILQKQRLRKEYFH